MTYLTEEQAQQIEEALVAIGSTLITLNFGKYLNEPHKEMWRVAKAKSSEALATIRAAIAEQQTERTQDAERNVVGLAEQAEQDPVHEALQIASVALQDIACSSQIDSLLWWQTRAREAQKQIAECLTNAAPAEPVKQEPVAWTYEEVKNAFEYLKTQVKSPDDKWTVGEACTYFGFFRHGIDAATQRCTAPVRTKDLTDDEILPDGYGVVTSYDGLLEFARAVIAADREKNK